MTTKQIKLLFVFWLICTLEVLFTNQMSMAQSRSTQRTNKVENKEVIKWEHCAIADFYALQQADKPPLGLAIICFFQESGCREVTIRVEGETRGFPPNELYEIARRKALSRAIAQLGNGGWELVGEMSFPKRFPTDEKDRTALYFKRRVQ